MRISVSAAALALGGSFVLGAFAAPAAVAAPQDCQTLGVAGQYGEFIEGNDTHSPDAEGAVAVGGNADFSHGFSVGQELTAAEVQALPGGNALVVAGDITVGGGNTEVMKGNGVYGGRTIGGGRLEAHAGTVVHGASPIDFAAEFAKLRALSTALAAQGASAGTGVAVSGDTVTLTGTDPDRDSFVVDAAQLQSATTIRLKVPAGAVTVVNVTGSGYDSRAARTTSIWLWDHTKQAYVEDDKLQSADGGAVRAALLWNFPTATKVVKNSPLAWAGSILAPNADFDLGDGGPVNGSVIAHSLTGSGGAETHHYPFTACLPVPPVVPPGVPSGPGSTPSAPTGTSSHPAGATPTATPTATHSGPAAPGPSTPSTSATPGTPSASPTAPGHGGLAFTGADGIVPLTVGGVLVLAAGGGIVLATKRRAAKKS
ncbi:choice-of-anchor A family protein [Kitasatospora sp. NPDC058965]|uniref:choice-of-anchor A family protein n=1 Tax=Kitasatospora sp. NPDC058965 TaxID=3346682 RepID=UPI00369D6245